MVYADTIFDLGFAHELANYGEYSGAPTDEQTFNYARTVLGLMTRTRRDDGKVLIVGGGIANFTDVAATFRGLVKALKMYRDELLAGSIKIYIRRAGPNYQEGLKMMLKLRQESGLFIRVFGPEQDAVSVCPLALGLVPEDSLQDFDPDRREVKVDEKAKVQPPPVPGSPVPRSPQRTFSAGSLSSLSVWKSNLRHRRDACAMAWQCRFLTARRRHPTHWLISPQVAVARRHEPDAVLG